MPNNSAADNIVQIIAQQLAAANVQLTPLQQVKLHDALCQQLGGMQLYIPRPDTDYTKWNRQQLQIRNEYRELLRGLCQKYGITERGLYRVVKGKPSTKPLKRTKPRQLLPPNIQPSLL